MKFNGQQGTKNKDELRRGKWGQKIRGCISASPNLLFQSD